ncbi:MAG: conjugative transposon protein TraN [Bacteroidota bacterium]
MKHLVSLVCACMVFVFSFSQSIQITTDKTTSLVFPFAVTHVDRGNKNVLVLQVKEAANILLLKAGAKNFDATNLSVVTSDGSFYSFDMSYADSPEKLKYEVPAQLHGAVEVYARSIIANGRTMHGIADHSWDVVSKIIGIYIKDNTLYYQLLLDNQSPIDYDIDFLRFYVRDKRKGRRTATQENELKALYECGNAKHVKANSKTVVVIALEKFTIPDAKYLAIEINEHNGGRHLKMRISNRKIVKAIVLPDLK